jgi:hypothetical protein
LELHDDPDVNALAFRDKNGTVDWRVQQRIQASSWRYNASAPAHNSNRFDLWSELKTEGTNVVIGNWPEAN